MHACNFNPDRVSGPLKSVPTGKTLRGMHMIFGLAVFCIWVADVSAQGADTGVEPGERTRTTVPVPGDLESLGREIRKVRESVSPAVCATFYFEGPNHGQRSGTAVVISAEGQLLTHGHHQPGLKPGDQMGVAVGGGRKDLATVIGVDRLMDLTLLKLNGPGPWPAVPIGDSSVLQHSDPCLALGFPLEYFGLDARPESPTRAMMRLGQYLGTNDQCIMTSCRTTGGDSGGPVFNIGGQLVGITRGSLLHDSRTLNTHVSSEVFQSVRKELERGVLRENTTALKPLADSASLPRNAIHVPKSVVAVHSNSAQVCRGVVIDTSGLILTKASEVSGELTCRLSDGEQVPARRLAVLQEHDLALLQIDRQGIPAVAWHRDDAGDGVPPIGTVVLSVDLGQKPVGFGVVAAELAAIPRERGQLALDTSDPQDGKGVQITAQPTRESLRKLIQPGDRVTHLEGHPTPDGTTFVNRREQMLDDSTRSVGDHLRVTIVRDGHTLQIEVPIVSQGEPSFRFRGFPKVFAHDVALPREFAGTPLVNLNGEVVGLTIVAADLDNPATCYALPNDVLEQAIVKLRAMAGMSTDK